MELAGAAAHELNQPLTSVMGYAQVLLRKLGPADAHVGAVEDDPRRGGSHGRDRAQAGRLDALRDEELRRWCADHRPGPFAQAQENLASATETDKHKQTDSNEDDHT